MNSQVNTDVYMQEYTRDDIIAKYISAIALVMALPISNTSMPRLTCVRSAH